MPPVGCRAEMDTILYLNASTDSVPSKVEKNGNVATLSYKHGAKLELTATEDYLAYRIHWPWIW